MVKIKKQLVSSGAKSFSGINGRKYITIHETANTSKGANAQAHANLMSNGFSASWHWTVDDEQAIQSYPHNVQCWHGGDGRGDGNLNSIGIEICVNSDGDFKKAVKNAAELVQIIMKEEGISLSHVVQHNLWSGKNCPTNLRNGSKGINWNDFINMVKSVDKVVEAPKTEVKSEVITKPKTEATPKPTGNLGLVDWMKSKGMNSSFGNRSKLAAQLGIKSYSGTFDQNIELLAKLQHGEAKKPEPKKETVSQPKVAPKGNMTTNSIVEYLMSIGVNSSFAHRKVLAKQYGISGTYTGTMGQNLELLKRMRNGSTPKKSAPKAPVFKVGYKVTLKTSASRYATGELIPSHLKGKKYTIQQVKSDRVLLKELYSWVKKSDLA